MTFYFVIAIIHTAVFTTSGILSSWVASFEGNDVVLIKNGTCGLPLYQSADEGDKSSLAAFGKHLYDTIAVSRQYAQSCYNRTSESAECGIFVKSRIPYTVDQNASCPFSSRYCDVSDTAAIQFDTGLIDTRDFGINEAAEDSAFVRFVTTCAPMVLGNFSIIANGSELNRADNTTIYSPDDTFVRFYLGPQSPEIKHTFEYNAHTIIDHVPYLLSSVASRGFGWTPIADIARSDADVSLFFITSNSVIYSSEVHDPVFNATTPIEDSPGYFYSPYYVSTMACVEQVQVCNSDAPAFRVDTSNCTPLGGYDSLGDAAELIPLTDQQQATLYRLQWHSYTASAFTQAFYLGPAALLASAYIGGSGLISTHLPNNHWHAEVRLWWETTLASFQYATMQYPERIQPLPQPGGVSVIEDHPSSYSQCSKQKAMSSGSHQSFALAGIVAILVAGGTIILLSFVIEPLVWKLQQWTGKGTWRGWRWRADDAVHLKRLALQQAGCQGWFKEQATIPVTDSQVSWDVVMDSMDGKLRFSRRAMDTQWPLMSTPGIVLQEHELEAQTPQLDNNNNSAQSTYFVPYKG